MPRLIDADALPVFRVKILHAFGIIEGNVIFPEDVKNAPTINAEPVRHGRWVREDDLASFIDVPWLCSECSGKILLSGLYTPLGHGFKYCPMCGAKMDAEPNKICPINGAPCNECVPGAYCAKIDEGADR